MIGEDNMICSFCKLCSTLKISDLDWKDCIFHPNSRQGGAVHLEDGGGYLKLPKCLKTYSQKGEPSQHLNLAVFDLPSGYLT
jgi:hypothetical protein